MSILSDSKAVLQERAKRVGLPDEALAKLFDQGVDTLAKLACAPGQPGEPPKDEKLKALIATDEKEPSVGVLAALRLLVFEAQTLLVYQSKSLVENKEDQVKELPAAERRERLKLQSQRLSGISLTGNAECSYASYDLCVKMQVDNTVSYLAPSKFTTRQSELKLEKPKKEIDIASNHVVIKDQQADQVCDVTNALNLHHALHRRALALDLVGLATYDKVQAYHEWLMRHIQEDPMPGFRPTSLQQLLHADRAAWLKLAEWTPDGIRRKDDGTNPLDEHWDDLQADPKVVFHLLPIPGASSSSSQARSVTSVSIEESLERPSKRPRKGKGKGKGKSSPSEPANTPPELKGLMSWTRTGKRRCWNFNLSTGCGDAKVGQDCKRGSHTCMRCGGHHGAHECPKKSQ